jgi:hypothetical protein
MNASDYGSARRSLFKRTLGAVFAVIFLIWVGLTARELIDIGWLQSRNGQAENQLWAQLARAQVQDKLDAPAAIEAALADLDQLRHAEWKQKGHRTPLSLVQVWHEGRLLQQREPRLKHRREPPREDRYASDDKWLYAEASDPERGLVIRRWQEMPGDWHFSVTGLSITRGRCCTGCRW